MRAAFELIYDGGARAHTEATMCVWMPTNKQGKKTCDEASPNKNIHPRVRSDSMPSTVFLYVFDSSGCEMMLRNSFTHRCHRKIVISHTHCRSPIAKKTLYFLRRRFRVSAYVSRLMTLWTRICDDIDASWISPICTIFVLYKCRLGE